MMRFTSRSWAVDVFCVAIRSFITAVAFTIVSTWSFNFAVEPRTTWPGWRGEQRDGKVAQLPTKWQPPEQLWEVSLPGPGVGGVAANEDFIVVSARDASDKSDVFTCVEPTTGSTLWELQYESTLELDYGNSPRATPMIVDPWVILLGAGGQLHCVDIDTGEIVWKKHLVDDFHGERPEWGYASSPLHVNGKLIVQPGGSTHSMVALSLKDGSILWQIPLEQTGYAAPQTTIRGDATQIIGFDKESLFGVDVKNGKLLWRILSAGAREFHVPTPLILDDAIVTTGEVHGTRRFEFNRDGTVNAQPTAEQMVLAPDMHSTVACAQWIIGTQQELFALDQESLEVAWRIEDEAFQGYCSLITDGHRLLSLSELGRLTLIDIRQNQESFQADPSRRMLGSTMLAEDASTCYAHPALVGNILYVRRQGSLTAWSLSDE